MRPSRRKSDSLARRLKSEIGMDKEILAALHTAIRGSKNREDIRTMQLLLSSLPPDENREELLRALVEKSAELQATPGMADGQPVA